MSEGIGDGLNTKKKPKSPGSARNKEIRRQCDSLKVAKDDISVRPNEGKVQSDANKGSTVELFKGSQKQSDSTMNISKFSTTRISNCSLSTRSLISPRLIRPMSQPSRKKQNTQMEMVNKKIPLIMGYTRLKATTLRDFEAELYMLKKRFLRAKTDCELYSRLKTKIMCQIMDSCKKMEVQTGRKPHLDEELKEIELFVNEMSETDTMNNQIENRISTDILSNLKSTLDKTKRDKFVLAEELKMMKQTLRDREDLIETLTSKLTKAKDEIKTLKVSYALEMEQVTKEMKKKDVEINFLKNESFLAKKQKKLAEELEEKNDFISAKIVRLEAELEDTKRQLSDSKLNESIVKREMNRLGRGESFDKISMEIDLNRTRKELEEVKCKLKSYQLEERKLNDELKKTQSTDNFLSNQLNKMKQKVEELTENLNLANETKNKVLLDLAQVKKEKELIEDELNGYKEELDQMAEELNKVRSEHGFQGKMLLTCGDRKLEYMHDTEDAEKNKKTAGFYKKLMRLTIEKNNLQQKVDNLTELLSIKSCSARSVDVENAANTFSDEELEGRDEKLMKKLERRRKEIEHLKRKLKEAEIKIESQTELMEALRKREEKLKQEEDLRILFKHILKKFSQKEKNKVQDILQQLENTQRKMRELEKSVKLLEEENERLEWVNSELKKEVADMSSKWRKSKSRLSATSDIVN